MQFLEDLIAYDFLSNAVIAAIFAGISCGIIGTYLVVRRMVFLGAGITHASFGGIGVAYYAGINPILGAMLFAISSAIGINILGKYDKVREDSAIGVLWALGMAIGVIFIFLTPGYTPNLMSFLFGNILTITPDILWANGIAAVVLTLVMLLWGRKIVYCAFDKQYSLSQGVNADMVNNLMMIATSIMIVLIIRLVGIVLLISLITIAPITINRFTNSYFKLTIYSSLFTIVASVAGIVVSYYTDLPSGAAIVVVLAAVYILSRGIRRA